MQMNNRVFVGNLPWKAEVSGLQAFFSEVGLVTDVHIVRERGCPTRSSGFGFISFERPEQASQAIAKLNGAEFMGRELQINPAHPRSERDRSAASITTQDRTAKVAKPEQKNHVQSSGEAITQE